MARLCPGCGRPVRGGSCPRCGRAQSERSREQEAGRRESHPERGRYSTAAFRRASQTALAMSRGRCVSCGRQIAYMRDGRWVFGRGLGGCHHIVPMADGGQDEPGNLAPLCARCHNAVDAALRRERRRREGI